MMNDEQPSSSNPYERAKKKDSRKFLLILLLLLLLLLIVALVTYIVLIGRMEPIAKDAGVDITPPSGERFEFSEFYHSGDGEWIIRDEGILVLKERKFISASEKDEYTVHEVKPGEKVRILRADQRWKFVETVPRGDTDKPITGWIDANNVRNADRVEEVEPTIAPTTHKAMKQQYPH